MLRKVINISIWLSLAIGVVVIYGFAQKSQQNTICKNVDIDIEVKDENVFVEREDILKLAEEAGNKLQNDKTSAIDVYKLEKIVRNHPSVQSADVFMDINGNVTIKVTQRKPIVRVYNFKGESFYIDEEGKLMPLSQNYTARVPIANGKILESYNAFYPYDFDDINDTLLKKTSLFGIYRLAKYINLNDFWKAQIEQIYINENKIELIPKVGNQTIVFGDTSDVEDKFNKLMFFYKEGLNKVGWNKYKIIDLQYKNQVVCK